MRGERLAICYADCVVVWDVRWNVQNGQFGTQCLQVLSAPKELHFCSSVLFPSGNHLVVRSVNKNRTSGALTIFSVPSGRRLIRLSIDQGVESNVVRQGGFSDVVVASLPVESVRFSEELSRSDIVLAVTGSHRAERFRFFAGLQRLAARDQLEEVTGSAGSLRGICMHKRTVIGRTSVGVICWDAITGDTLFARTFGSEIGHPLAIIGSQSWTGSRGHEDGGDDLTDVNSTPTTTASSDGARTLPVWAVISAKPSMARSFLFSWLGVAGAAEFTCLTDVYNDSDADEILDILTDGEMGAVLHEQWITLLSVKHLQIRSHLHLPAKAQAMALWNGILAYSLPDGVHLMHILKLLSETVLPCPVSSTGSNSLKK